MQGNQRSRTSLWCGKLTKKCSVNEQDIQVVSLRNTLCLNDYVSKACQEIQRYKEKRHFINEQLSSIVCMTINDSCVDKEEEVISLFVVSKITLKTKRNLLYAVFLNILVRGRYVAVASLVTSYNNSLCVSQVSYARVF